jgi:hypothetical protein
MYNNIEISTSIRYNKSYKHLQPITNKQINWAQSVLEKCKDYLLLPKDLKIHFRPIYKDIYFGLYCNDLKTVFIDPRQNKSRKTFLCTLIHELAHADQFENGYLEDNDDGSVIWHGVLHPCIGNINYDKYSNLPWEKDAEKVVKNLLPILKK